MFHEQLGAGSGDGGEWKKRVIFMARGLDSGSSPTTQLLRALGRSPKLCEPQLLTSKVTVTHGGEMPIQVCIHTLVPVLF